MPILRIVGNLAAALLAVAVLSASGARLRRWLRLPCPPRSAPATDLMLGAGLCAVLVLILGLIGLLRTPWLLAVVVAQAAMGRWRRRAASDTSLLTAAVLAGLPNLLIALAPPFFYDALVYHLGLPWQALMEGAWRAHPENLFASFPPLNQLVSTPWLAISALRVPAVLHWWAWVAAAVAAAGVARSLGASRRVGLLVAAAAMLLPATPLVPGFPAAEGWFLAALAPAIGLLVRPRLPGTGLPLVMLLLGLACACRVQGLPWLGIAVLIWLWRSRDLGSLLRAAPWAVLGTLPWWLKNTLLLGRPIAPVFDAREGIETLWRDSGSLLMGGASPLQVLAQLAGVLAPLALSLLPLAMAAVLVCLANPRSRPVASAVVLGALAWAATGTLPRFLAPMSILLLTSVATASQTPGLRRWLAAVVLAWHLVLGAAAQFAQLGLVRPFDLLGRSLADAAQRTTPCSPLAAYQELSDRINSDVGVDARIMVVGEARGFGLPAPFTISSQHDVPPLRALIESSRQPQEVVAKLRDRGYTHLVVNRGELQRLLQSYPVAPWRTARGEALWWWLLQSLGSPVVERGGVQVFALAGANSGGRQKHTEWGAGTAPSRVQSLRELLRDSGEGIVELNAHSHSR